MKILSILFIALIGLMCLTQITLSQSCLEYISAFSRKETRVVPCQKVTTNDKRDSLPSENMFSVDFNCLTDDKELCGKVEKVFVTAGKFITATLDLTSPVKVNATFLNLCEVIIGGCTANSTVLGAARPTRLIPHQGPKDDKVRFYPQALYKQMNLPEHPEFAPNEVMIVFNSNATYWFEGDSLPVKGRQADMLYVVLHELIHGLGFVNSWNDYFNMEGLTPAIGPKLTPTVKGTGEFFEFIFDKYLVLLPSGKRVSSLTDELNKFPINLSVTDEEFVTSFKASSQFPIAKSMFEKAITPRSLGLQLAPNNVIVLETSLLPFRPGSSIGHVDLKTYLNSSDFLMMYTYPKSFTLGQIMHNSGSTNKTGPIGPKLRLLLSKIGYKVKGKYVPPVKLSY